MIVEYHGREYDSVTELCRKMGVSYINFATWKNINREMLREVFNYNKFEFDERIFDLYLAKKRK